MTFRQECTVMERFEQKFIPEPNSGCFIWTASLHRDGYGRFMVTISPGKKKLRSAHKLSWILYRGDIPEGICVLHTCDQRWCVNPDHLYLGTHQDNSDDMMERGRWRPPSPESRHLQPTKISDEDVRLIRADERMHRIIAAEYGIARALVTQIKSGRKRRNVV